MPCFVDFEKKFNLNLIEIKVHVVNINEFKTPRGSCQVGRRTYRVTS